jgi:hypothetical protein
VISKKQAGALRVQPEKIADSFFFEFLGLLGFIMAQFFAPNLGLDALFHIRAFQQV